MSTVEQDSYGHSQVSSSTHPRSSLPGLSGMPQKLMVLLELYSIWQMHVLCNLLLERLVQQSCGCSQVLPIYNV